MAAMLLMVRRKTMAKYIANAFSLQMLQGDATINVRQISADEFTIATADAISAVGHPDTAAVLGVQCARINVALHQGDQLYVAQLTGGRLPEGATTLPEGFSFKYIRVDVL